MALRPDLVGTTPAQLPLWLSLDAAELVGLVWISVAAARPSRHFLLASSFTAALLFCDATYDVATSLTSGDTLLAVTTALFVELPAGAVLLRAALVNQMGRPTTAWLTA